MTNSAPQINGHVVIRPADITHLDAPDVLQIVELACQIR